MTDIHPYCNSFATASSNHENDTGATLESTEEVLYAKSMIKIPVETPTATLRYALAPDEAGIAAIEATFAAYDRMMAILAEVAPVGANLVALHAQAYEKIRVETGLPARLVTLGLRDRAGYVADTAMRRIPLDDKLFAIKGPTSLTISTVQGRVLVPFDVPGYVAGWESPFPAHLVSDGHAYEIQIAVKSKSIQPEEKTMLHEGILARMGRLLAAIASQTIDNAENSNKLALVKQAIREIDEQTKALQAMLAARREAETRLADLEASLLQHAPLEPGRAAPTTNMMSTDRAMAAIARVTGVPAASVLGDKELDELDRLHREKEIAARLERIKSQQ